jgi:hypothetical protein
LSSVPCPGVPVYAGQCSKDRAKTGEGRQRRRPARGSRRRQPGASGPATWSRRSGLTSDGTNDRLCIPLRTLGIARTRGRSRARPPAAAPIPARVLPPGPMPDVASGGVRTPLDPGLCAACDRPLTVDARSGSAPRSAASPAPSDAHRRARGRGSPSPRGERHAAPAGGRARRLVGQLKRRRWPGA